MNKAEFMGLVTVFTDPQNDVLARMRKLAQRLLTEVQCEVYGDTGKNNTVQKFLDAGCSIQDVFDEAFRRFQARGHGVTDADLDRKVLIEVTPYGQLAYRAKGCHLLHRAYPDALPVFSVDHEAEAMFMIKKVGIFTWWKGAPVYELQHQMDFIDIPRTLEILRECWKDIIVRRSGAEEPPPVSEFKGKPMPANENERCHSQKDGDCDWQFCPQNKEGEPQKTGRHCPLDWDRDLDYH
jgi:hypothetical protein